MQHEFIKEHDVKRFFLFVTATSLEEAMHRADAYLKDWSLDKIPEAELPPYAYQFNRAFFNSDTRPSNVVPYVIIDSAGQMHWIQGDVLADNIWLVFYAVGC